MGWAVLPPLVGTTSDTFPHLSHTYVFFTPQINDRYEFPDVLDLDFEDRKIFAPEADKTVRNLYRLHR